MIKEILKNKMRVFWLILCLFGLILVRAFEDHLFYDPFLQFFKYDYQNKPLFFRYVLNTLFSIAIIYLLFKQLQLVKFSAILFGILGVVLMVLFFGLLHFFNQPDYLILFYLRRFLIQPLFLVLFIPAFYYQHITK